MVFNKVICKVSLFNVVSMLKARKAMKRILVREELCFACGLRGLLHSAVFQIKAYLEESPQPDQNRNGQADVIRRAMPLLRIPALR